MKQIRKVLGADLRSKKFTTKRSNVVNPPRIPLHSQKITVIKSQAKRHSHFLSSHKKSVTPHPTSNPHLRVPLFFFFPFSQTRKINRILQNTLLARMAKTRPGRKDVDSYTIRGTNRIVRTGDCVLMRPSDTSKPPYVARVEKIEQDNRNNTKVRVRWYYRPEESIGGRRQFHGAKELFLSDHYDVQSAHTIEGKCVVHSFKNYTKLENVGAEDYYCRFEYKAATGAFTPDRVAVYCKCEMPYNPDDLMVQCEGCKDWYHPACMGMTIEEAKKLDHFVCSECSSDDDMKKPQATFTALPGADGKVEPKRRKR